ncbi:hypothetical protein [Absidia glauca]|uniref:CCHC-type domain-containing protein n=1 Tax=Absidia glauca TaxID=4829 RepID=A0A168S010_ABSGL|nr:hypothetical protein [Absidia glauca]
MTRYAKLGGKAKHVKTSDEFNVTPLVPNKKAGHQETAQSNGPEPVSNNDKSDHNDNKKRPNKQMNKKRKFDNTADDISTRKERRNRAKDRNTICFGCRQKGHSVENCKESKQSIQGICYNCGSTEHSLKHCKKPRKGNALPYAKCFVCDGKGHLAGQCPENTKGLYPNGGGCRFCGQVDHLAKDCKVTKDQAGTTVVGKIDLDQGADDDDYHIFVTEQRKHTKEVADEKKIAAPVVDRRPAQKKKVVKF